jgi:hypothetical protein
MNGVCGEIYPRRPSFGVLSSFPEFETVQKSLGSIVPLKILKVRKRIKSKEGRKPLLLPVLEALSQGPATDRQMADRLGISVGAARGQLHTLCLKEHAVAKPPNARHPKFKITTAGREELRRHRAFGPKGTHGTSFPPLVV